MSNYDAIKEMNVDIMASFLAQISFCGKTSMHTPNKDEWKEYLLGNAMFLPFDSKKESDKL